MRSHQSGETGARAFASRCARLSRQILALPWLFLPSLLALQEGSRKPRQQRLLHEGFLPRLELGLYHAIIVPLVAFLPAPLAYGVACLQGNLRYHLDRAKRTYILQGLEGVMGGQMSPAERIQITRDYFRLVSCEAIDVMRLAGKGHAFIRLVEIRGLEHIEAALAKGKGAILCCAHFGSYDSSFSLLGALGFHLTGVGRRPSRLNKNRTPLERLIFRLVILKSLVHHRHRPNIEPRGQVETAVQIAKILRQNELVGILIDPPVLDVDRPRAVPINFLNGQAMLIPGVTTIAQLVGAPVLMTFMRRSEDWQHQVLEISPPLPVDGDPLAAFSRCLAGVEAAIRRNPAHWHYWGKYALTDLGLLKEEPEPLREGDQEIKRVEMGIE